MLIKELATLFGPTVARQLIAWFLDGELVVVSELFALVDFPQRKNDYVLFPINIDHTGVAVGLAGVVDETSRVAVNGGVYYLIVIDAKHVAANSLVNKKKFKNHIAIHVCILIAQ